MRINIRIAVAGKMFNTRQHVLSFHSLYKRRNMFGNMRSIRTKCTKTNLVFIILMLDQDSALRAVPEHIVIIGFFAFIYFDKAGVYIIPFQFRQAVLAVAVGSPSRAAEIEALAALPTAGTMKTSSYCTFSAKGIAIL